MCVSPTSVLVPCRSGEFVFRKPTDAGPEHWPRVHVHSVQPVLACVGTILFGLSPGLTLSNKPSGHRHHVSAAQRIGGLSGAAILAAIPAAAAAVAVSFGRQPMWMAPSMCATWTRTQPSAVPSEPRQPEAVQEDVPEAKSSVEVTTGVYGTVAVQQQPSVPVRQQVAMAKDLMLQLREQLWHGLETPKRGRHAYPAVFHVSLSPGARVPLVHRIPAWWRDAFL